MLFIEHEIHTNVTSIRCLIRARCNDEMVVVDVEHVQFTVIPHTTAHTATTPAAFTARDGVTWRMYKANAGKWFTPIFGEALYILLTNHH